MVATAKTIGPRRALRRLAIVGAACLWAMASMPSLPSRGGEADPAGDVDPVVSYIAETEGVSLEEAEVRADVESRAGELGATVEEALSSRFGGIYVSDDSRIEIQVVGPTTTDLRLIQNLAETDDVSGWVDVVASDISLDDLSDAADGLRDRLLSEFAEFDFSVEPDTRSGRIHLEVPIDARERIGDWLTENPLGVEVDLEGFESAGFASCVTTPPLLHCDPPIRGGVAVSNIGICTAGFVAKGHTSGNPYIVTAGHCIHTIGDTWGAQDSAGFTFLLGTSHSTTLNTPKYSDIGLIAVTNSAKWKPTRGILLLLDSVSTGHDQTYPISAIGTNVVGQRVCMTGEASGTQCSTVLETGVAMVVEGVQLRTMVRAGICPINGDSGGPLYAQHKAYGIVSGFVGGGANCWGFYTGASKILPQLNADVLLS